jgi:hypothetical protein
MSHAACDQQNSSARAERAHGTASETRTGIDYSRF